MVNKNITTIKDVINWFGVRGDNICELMIDEWYADEKFIYIRPNRQWCEDLQEEWMLDALEKGKPFIAYTIRSSCAEADEAVDLKHIKISLKAG